MVPVVIEVVASLGFTFTPDLPRPAQGNIIRVGRCGTRIAKEDLPNASYQLHSP